LALQRSQSSFWITKDIHFYQIIDAISKKLVI